MISSRYTYKMKNVDKAIMINKLVKIALLVVLSLIQMKPSEASSQFVPSWAWKAVQKGISSTWSSSSPGASWIQISFCVSDEGKIYDPTIDKHSGNDQYDAECLESICSLSPLMPDIDNHFSVLLNHCIFTFGSKVALFNPKPRYDGKEVVLYLSNHQRPAANQNFEETFVLVHKIPLSVLNRYPGMFTEAELRDSSNLIPITFRQEDWNKYQIIAPYVLPIGNLYAYWGQLFKKEKVTREDILTWAQVAEQRAK